MQDGKEVIVKTIRKEFKDKIKAGIIWYTLISVINNLRLAKREIQLLAFINYRGTISSLSSKEEFCKIFDSSNATISNMISRLTILKLLIKEKGKTKVNPALRVDFNNDFIVRFFINVIPDIKEEVLDGDK